MQKRQQGRLEKPARIPLFLDDYAFEIGTVSRSPARMELTALVRLPAMHAGAQARSDTVVVEAPGDSVQSATFDVRQAPYSVHAEVELPHGPGRGQLSVRVALDTLALDVRVRCERANACKVRTAEVSAIAPEWATVKLDRVDHTTGVWEQPVPGKSRGRRSTVRVVIGRFGVSVG
jgi:hypothetical protein